jgi:hypothetical protein
LVGHENSADDGGEASKMALARALRVGQDRRSNSSVRSVEPLVRSKVAEAFADKITEWIARSNSKVRADVVHDKLVAMGYQGSERTTRRVVAALKAAYEHEHHRTYMPWITEPGAWPAVGVVRKRVRQSLGSHVASGSTADDEVDMEPSP